MASTSCTNTKKSYCQRCRTPFTDTGDGKEYYKGYHNECLKCSLCDVPMDYKNISLKPSPVDYAFCKKCDSIFSFVDFNNCLRCQRPFTDTEEGREFYRGYHKKCMKCATCGIALDATNIYLTAEKTKDLYCNECKGRRLSTESLSHLLKRSSKSKTAIDTIKSDESIWYDCSSASFNTIPNLVDQDKDFGDQNGSLAEGNQSSKIHDVIQLGYRDLHGRGSKENLNRSISISENNISNAGESTKNVIPQARTGIPQRLGNAGSLKKSSAINNIHTAVIKVPYAKVTTVKCNDTTGSKGQSVLKSRNTTPVTSTSGPTPIIPGAISTVKHRYNLRRPSISTGKSNAATTLPEVIATTDSQDIELTASDGLQSPVDTTKPKSFKHIIRKAFNKYSRAVPVKAFPPESQTDTVDDPIGLITENDGNDGASAVIPKEEKRKSLSRTAKQRRLYLDCSICFESLLDNEESELNKPSSSVVSTKCGHIFHEKCIKEWLKAQSNKKCPICCSSCSTSSLLTIFVDGGPHREGCPSPANASITDEEINEIHETLQNDYDDLRLKYDKLEADHELCGWKSVVIQSLQSAFDLESFRRQELERENEYLLKKMETMQLEAFIRQSSEFKPINF